MERVYSEPDLPVSLGLLEKRVRAGVPPNMRGHARRNGETALEGV